MVRSCEGEDLAGANMARANMAGANMAGGGSPIWREPVWREPDLSRPTLQVYVSRTECPVVDSCACRDHRSVQHTLYVHLDVLPAVKIC